MAVPDSTSSRRVLRDAGRSSYAAMAGLVALIFVNAAASGVFAASYTILLVRGAETAALGAGFALAVRAAVSSASSRLAARQARQVKRRLRATLLVAALSRRRGNRAAVGEVVGTIVDEVEALDGYFARYRPAALEARLAPVLVALLVAIASPVSAAILIATLAPFAALMAIAGSAAAGEAGRQFGALARLSGLFVDRVQALPVVLSFQAEAAETRKVEVAAADVGRRTLAVLRIAFVSTAALEFFAALAVALVAVYCGFSLLGLLPFRPPERLDFGRAFFALALAPEFYGPMRRLAGAYHEKQLGEAAAARLGPWLSPARAPTRISLDGPPAIRLEGVRLDVGDAQIGPVTADLPQGGVTVIVGPTGAGKSSLLAALLGLAPLAGGAIHVGGRRLAPDESLAGQASWAGQSPVFLPGGVAENLRLAAPSADAAQARAMAEAVGLGPTLARRGAQMRLDERASGLSGGERRRLAIARALLNPSPLLLLDEPTADLDAASEAALLELILKERGRRTIVIATHAARVAAAADCVVRLA